VSTLPRLDPRLRVTPQTANEILLDRTIRHLIYQLRVQNQQTGAALEFLEMHVYPDLLQKIETRLARIAERGFDRGPVTTRRLHELEMALHTMLTTGHEALFTQIQDALSALAEHEVHWQAAVIQEATRGILIETVIPSVPQIRAALTIPMEGFPLRDWFENLTTTTQRRLTQQIGIGIVQGETNEQIMRRIRGTRANKFMDGILQMSRRDAETLVRTATIHIGTQARRLMLEENEDILQGEGWIATLDLRTCVRCMSLDKKNWKTGTSHPWPPIHGR
jgi:hypothetical protein